MSVSAQIALERPEAEGTQRHAARGLSPDGNVNAAITTPVTAAKMPKATNAPDADFKVATRIASASKAAAVATIDASRTS